MKKKLLFVMSSMDSGGGERSLLTLLTLLDYDRYDVDLFLFDRSGLFFEMLPAQVNLLPHSRDYADFTLPFAASVRALAKRGRFSLLFDRIRYANNLRRFAARSLQADAKAWRFLKRSLKTDWSVYDAAIGYLEGNPNYFVAESVNAKQKIAWIHSDYAKLPADPASDLSFFEKVDRLVAVSPECAASLQAAFPTQAEKVTVIENITSPTVVRAMAAAGAAPEFDADVPCLLTVGRMAPPKGYDLALDAAEKLKADGAAFRWFCIGTGGLRRQIEQTIAEKNLDDCFVLLGERANPYPYMAQCDIYVQPSRYEGKSIALDEAKSFAKPIVATRFSTVFDQLTDGETALLAEMDGADIAEKIERLLAEEPLKTKLTETLKRETVGNEEELDKFYALIERKS